MLIPYRLMACLPAKAGARGWRLLTTTLTDGYGIYCIFVSHLRNSAFSEFC